MDTIGKHLLERRRYIRLDISAPISYTFPDNRKIYKAVTKNISADGIRFEAHHKTLDVAGVIDVTLSIPGPAHPVHARCRVIWKRKVSLEDKAPFDIGVEIIELGEEDKNLFLKFLCDALYSLAPEKKR
ncbi:MAG: PilZ domain-containing protein [Candidatus Omnitrophota bacterium]